jgi:hypothetical protein
VTCTPKTPSDRRSPKSETRIGASRGKKTRYSEVQIIGVLKRMEAGRYLDEIGVAL